MKKYLIFYNFIFGEYYAAKGVKVIRVHDVKETVDALKAYSKVMREDL